MKILEDVLDKIIISSPLVPPETGGIIGGKNQIVSHVVFDSGNKNSNGYDIYAPNTAFLNQMISRWCDEDIALYGIFHCHFPGKYALSNGDRYYISQIMDSLSSQVKSLYFPIILPREKMVVYRADNIDGNIHIISEDIEII